MSISLKASTITKTWYCTVSNNSNVICQIGNPIKADQVYATQDPVTFQWTLHCVGGGNNNCDWENGCGNQSIIGFYDDALGDTMLYYAIAQIGQGNCSNSYNSNIYVESTGYTYYRTVNWSVGSVTHIDITITEDTGN